MSQLYMLLTITSLLIATPIANAAYIPSPYPSATASPSPSVSSGPSPTLAPRCGPNGCDFGPGTAIPLQASVVTSTILSITSVPCYITTYVTNSKTVTDTIYSTETITETVTKEGKVFIVQYEPKPILRITKVPKVFQITVDVDSAWIESGTDTPMVSTVKEEWSTMAPAPAGHCPECESKPQPQPQPQPAVQPQPQQEGSPAWVHASSAGGGLAPGRVPQGDGWAAAAGTGQQGGGTTWSNGNGQGTWTSAASSTADSRTGLICVLMLVGVMMFGEMIHQLR